MSLYPPPASTSIKDIPTVDLDNPPPPVEVLKMGVWTAYRARPGMSQLLFFIINILSGRGSAESGIPRVVSLVKVILNYVQGWCHYKIRSSRALLTFLVEVFWLVPLSTWANYIACTAIVSSFPTINIWINSKVAGTLNTQLELQQTPNTSLIILALASRGVFSIVEKTCEWYRDDIERGMERRIDEYFSARIVNALTRLSLTRLRNRSPDPDTRYTWGMFKNLWNLLEATFFTITNMILLISSIEDHAVGTCMIMLFFLKPMLEYYFLPGQFYDQAYVYHATNPFYVRAGNMYSLATRSDHRLQVVTNNIGEYISREYTRAQYQYSGESTLQPIAQYQLHEKRAWDLILKFFDLLPLVFYVATSRLNAGVFSLSSFLIIRDLGSAIHKSLIQVKNSTDVWSQNLSDITALYDELNGSRYIPDGHLPYPTPRDKACSPKGMEFDFRSVTYKHPCTDPSHHPALDKISFKIPASSLVVVVGTNGSGKTSLLDLLGRIQEPASGEILLDGEPFSEYCEQDIRRVIAFNPKELLAELSLFDNVALGDEDVDKVYNASPKCVYDTVNKAARLGLADSFLGPATVSDSTSRWQQKLAGNWPNMSTKALTGDLQRIYDEISQTPGCSDGEKQRIGNSRVFMRLLTGRTQLLLLDEPNSALDSDAERKLFENILSHRQGMTVVVVLNRFQDIMMRSADLILCMQEGKLVESGTHEELLKLDKVYSRLYHKTPDSKLPNGVKDVLVSPMEFS